MSQTNPSRADTSLSVSRCGGRGGIRSSVALLIEPACLVVLASLWRRERLASTTLLRLASFTGDNGEVKASSAPQPNRTAETKRPPPDAERSGVQESKQTPQQRFEARMRGFSAAFRYADSDRDGVVSYDEFVRSGLGDAEEFHAATPTGSRGLSMDRFVAFKRKLAIQVRRFEAEFRSVDIDDDGVVNEEEFVEGGLGEAARGRRDGCRVASRGERRPLLRAAVPTSPGFGAVLLGPDPEPSAPRCRWRH